ncbi:MAG: T9SS type A sorting domain-containing protein, partial [Bacteroidota bacterium]
EDFREVTFIEGAGTTVEQQDYAYRLSDLTPDVYRLRLKQIDFDGTTDYSDVVEATVEVPGTHVLESAYPNPFNPQATFSVVVAETQPVRVELYDLSGRLVETLFAGELQANQAERFTIDGSSLSSGTYLYRLTGATFTEAKRVTLAK